MKSGEVKWEREGVEIHVRALRFGAFVVHVEDAAGATAALTGAR